MQSFPIDTTGANMRYVELAGDGLPLLMIHGLGCAASFEYPHVVSAPALKGRHVLLIDLPGFGYSDRPDDFGYGIADHARQIANLALARGFERLDLYGHSMGGAVAIEAADGLGARVAHLVLSEANLDSGGGQFSRAIAASTQADYIDRSHQTLISKARTVGNADWASTMQAASPRAVHRAAKSLVDGATPNWRARFLAHPARRTFVFGARSLPDPDAERLAAAGIEIAIVPDAGHSMGLENPHGLARVIAEATG